MCRPPVRLRRVTGALGEAEVGFRPQNLAYLPCASPSASCASACLPVYPAASCAAPGIWGLGRAGDEG